MGITGSLILYVIIWWIVFFSILPVGIKSQNREFKENLAGNDPGAPKNPNILKFFNDYINNFNHFFINLLCSKKWLF